MARTLTLSFITVICDPLPTSFVENISSTAAWKAKANCPKVKSHFWEIAYVLITQFQRILPIKQIHK